MQTVTIHDAKTNLSKYIAMAKSNQPIFVGGFGKPEVKIVKVTLSDLAESKTRNFFVAKNKVIEKDDSFSDETELLIEEMLSGQKVELS